MGGLPLLDYKNPIKTITTTGTYTANKDCYLVGTMALVNSQVGNVSDIILYVNGCVVGRTICYHAVSGTATGPFVLKIKNGDVIKISSTYPNLQDTAITINFCLLSPLE